MKTQPRTEAFNTLGQSLEALIASLLTDRNAVSLGRVQEVANG